MIFMSEYRLILFLLMEQEVDPVSVLIETFRRHVSWPQTLALSTWKYIDFIDL